MLCFAKIVAALASSPYRIPAFAVNGLSTKGVFGYALRKAVQFRVLQRAVVWTEPTNQPQPITNKPITNQTITNQPTNQRKLSGFMNNQRADLPKKVLKEAPTRFTARKHGGKSVNYLTQAAWRNEPNFPRR